MATLFDIHPGFRNLEPDTRFNLIRDIRSFRRAPRPTTKKLTKTKPKTKSSTRGTNINRQMEKLNSSQVQQLLELLGDSLDED